MLKMFLRICSNFLYLSLQFFYKIFKPKKKQLPVLLENFVQETKSEQKVLFNLYACVLNYSKL